MTDAPAPLEPGPAQAVPPHLIDAPIVEDATFCCHTVSGTPEPALAAFLDGAQESRVLAWMGPVPIVYASTGAAVRERADRRLRTWGAPLVRRRIYAPLAFLDDDALTAVFPAGSLVDTLAAGESGARPQRHPSLLLELARTAVSREREHLEIELAERWCSERSEPILVDGGIGASERVARAPCAVGVIKSHHTLYADGPALDTVLALRGGERSSVVRIAPQRRASVHSWYLRLRDPAGTDALFGLVRVEVAEGPRAEARADQVSRWLLAEGAPLALPDPRWDRMTYGVRNTEEFIRAIGVGT